ncbi:kinase-like domain-containing protein [Chytridium lagenaria]|nr:kinase-like domain-containing protein [Chytridium lagenaria]
MPAEKRQRLRYWVPKKAARNKKVSAMDAAMVEEGAITDVWSQFEDLVKKHIDSTVIKQVRKKIAELLKTSQKAGKKEGKRKHREPSAESVQFSENHQKRPKAKHGGKRSEKVSSEAATDDFVPPHTNVFNKEFTPISTVALNKLGKGGNGTVHRVCSSKGKLYARKYIHTKVATTLQAKLIWDEVEILKLARSCPQLITLEGAYEFRGRLFLFTNVCTMDLFSYADIFESTLQQRIPIATVKMIGVELVKGISFLHDRGILHGDIKLENVFVNVDKSNNRITSVQLGDFGASRVIGKGLLVGCRGTHGYMPPEMFMNEFYGIDADWFSFAVTLLNMRLMEDVFDPFHGQQLCEAIKAQCWMVKYPQNHHKSNERRLQDFLEKVLVVDRTQRLGYKGSVEIKGHAFFAYTAWNL